MAFTLTILVDDPDTGGADTYASPSVTPAASKPLLLFASSSGTVSSTNPAPDTPTWLDGAWTLERSQPDTAMEMNCWSGKSVSSPGADTVSVLFTDPASDPQTGCHIILVEIDGAHASDPFPAAAAGNSGTATSGSVTVGALVAATSLVLAAFGHMVNEAHTPSDGETEAVDNGYDSPTRRMSVQSKVNDTSSAASWATSAFWQAIGIEVQAAASGVTGTVNQVTETEVVNAITPVRVKAVGQVVETEAVQAITGFRFKTVGQVVETETVNAIAGSTAAKFAAAGGVYLFGDEEGVAAAVGQVIETEVVQLMVVHSLRLVTQVVETEVVNAMTPLRIRALGQVTATEVVNAVTPLRIRALGQVTETETANAVTPSLASAGGPGLRGSKLLKGLGE